MENKSSNKTAWVAWATGLAFAATATLGAYQYRVIENKNLDITKVNNTTDSLIIVKSNLKNEVVALTENLEKEIEEGKKTEEELAKLNATLIEKNRELKNLRNQRTNNARAQKAKDEEIALLNGQINDLNKQKSEMEQELGKIPLLEAEQLRLNAALAQWETYYQKLKDEFQELDQKHARLLFDAPGDNFHVEALTQSDKLTSKAKKTKKIRVSFLMPAYMQRQMSGSKSVYLSLFDDKIKPIPGAIKEVSVNAPGSSAIPIEIHAVQTVDYTKNPQVVAFTVEIDQKLLPGLYKGKVYSDDDYLGTVDFRLKDSFMFF